METKTLLLDPLSSSADRSIWRIPAGTKFLAGKVRLGNFRIQNNSALPIYFGTQGIYSLILRVSILNLEGTEIDRLAGDGLQMMALRLMQAENAAQYSINRQLAQSMCNSITIPSMSQKQLTEQSGRDSATYLSAYIDISSMLKYLGVARNIIDEGMIVQCEWNAPSMVANGYSFDRFPCLMIDEVISNLPADAGNVFTFPTIISERLSIPIPDSVDPTLVSYERRLNSYYSQYIQNIYSLMITSPLAPTERNPYNLAYAPSDETMSLTIDGRQLIPFNSVNTDSKKLAFLTDFFGPVTMPGVEAAYHGIKAYSDKSNGDTELWGLTNPNTGVRMNGVLSYGAIKVGQFITNDITIVYTATLDGAVGQYATLVLLAECVRVYTKSTGIIANLQLPPVVNTI
jgi:hypothetical protein